MATVTLQGLPAEMIHEIFKHLDVDDHRTLRLANRHLGSIANEYALKNVTFCTCKRDFDMLRELMKQPNLLRHIQSLIYVVDTLSLERQTLEMYTRAVERDDILTVSVGKWFGRETGPPPKPLTPAELKQNFDRYTQFYNEQEDILVNQHDHQVLKELFAKLPNLKSINVSSDDETASIKNSPFKDGCRKVCDGRFVDGRMSTRHLQAMLKAIQASGVRLQTFRCYSVHYDIFDLPSFGLHSIVDLLGNITYFELGIEAVEDAHLPIGMDDPHEIFGDLLECNKTMKSGTLQRILGSMPNLVTLRLSFVEYHGESQGSFPPPAFLQHVLPRRAKWPKLKEFLISNVMTDRQPLAKFLQRHRETLKCVRLDQIRLATTSWMKLLPMLRKLFVGSGIDVAITDFIMSVSETEDGTTVPEMWELGHPDWDFVRHQFGMPENTDSNQLGNAVKKYITLKTKQECPLREDNMHFWETEDEDDDDYFSDEEIEDEVFWEDELEDELPDLIPMDY